MTTNTVPMVTNRARELVDKGSAIVGTRYDIDGVVVFDVVVLVLTFEVGVLSVVLLSVFPESSLS